MTTQVTIIEERSSTPKTLDFNSLSMDKIKELSKGLDALEEKKPGMISIDSVEYFSFKAEVKPSRKIRIRFVAPTLRLVVEKDRTSGATIGEKHIPAVLFMDKKSKDKDDDGEMFINAASLFVKHFIGKSSGYEVEVTFKGTRPSKTTGNPVETFTFRQLT